MILRGLLAGRRRYPELALGLPGIPSNLLSTRLRELEDDGLVVRELQTDRGRSVVYRATPRAEQLAPALDELGRWGAATMREPREDEVVTDASLMTALRAAAHGRIPRKDRSRVYVVRAGEAVVHVTMHNGSLAVAAGEHTDPDLTIIAGPRFRDLLAGEIEPESAERAGAATLNGDSASLIDFCAAFRIPYADEHATRPPPTTQRPDR